MVPHSTNVTPDEALDLLESWLDSGKWSNLDPAQELGVHNAIREMREHAASVQPPPPAKPKRKRTSKKAGPK